MIDLRDPDTLMKMREYQAQRAAKLEERVASLQALLDEAREALREIAFAGEGKDVRGMAQAALSGLRLPVEASARESLTDRLDACCAEAGELEKLRAEVVALDKANEALGEEVVRLRLRAEAASQRDEKDRTDA